MTSSPTQRYSTIDSEPCSPQRPDERFGSLARGIHPQLQERHQWFGETHEGYTVQQQYGTDWPGGSSSTQQPTQGTDWPGGSSSTQQPMQVCFHVVTTIFPLHKSTTNSPSTLSRRMSTSGSTDCSDLIRPRTLRRLPRNNPTMAYEMYAAPLTGLPSLRISYAVRASDGEMYHK